MKKITKMLLITIFILTSILPQTINAQENKNIDVNFTGQITPLRKFYLGEYAKYSDFRLTGEFVDEYGNNIPKDEWKIFAFESVKNKTINVVISHIPSMDSDNIVYNDIKYTVDIQTEKFNNKLRSNYKNNIKAANVTDALSNLKFYNSIGNEVKVTIEYDIIDKLDNNKILVKYTLTPNVKYIFTDYGYEQYDSLTNNIIVYKIKRNKTNK